MTLGTRASALARVQTDSVVELLAAAWPGLTCDVRPSRPGRPDPGERASRFRRSAARVSSPLELERELRDGEIDLAVHSLKDLPTEDAPGVVDRGGLPRARTRATASSRGTGSRSPSFRAGAVVGTSSLRREAQLRALRPDLEIRSIRGNVDTRVDKVRDG